MNQMPILTLLSQLKQLLVRLFLSWTRAVGLGPVPERQLAAPAAGASSPLQSLSKLALVPALPPAPLLVLVPAREKPAAPAPAPAEVIAAAMLAAEPRSAAPQDPDNVIALRPRPPAATQLSLSAPPAATMASPTRRARAALFIAGQGARIFSMEAFRRARLDRGDHAPQIA